MRVSSPRKGEVKGWNMCIREAKFGKKLKLHQYKYAIASISSSSPYITMPQSQGKILRAHSIICKELYAHSVYP